MDFSLVSLTQNDKNSQIPQNSAKTKTKCGFFATLKMTMPCRFCKWIFRLFLQKAQNDKFSQKFSQKQRQSVDFSFAKLTQNDNVDFAF